MIFKVLLIEDTEEVRDLVRSALGRSFEVGWGPTLQEAAQLMEKGEYHLILLDVGLPDGDGFHFFSTLKNDDKFKNIPVIFLTARTADSDKIMGISMGAEDYITKPFSPAELKARVEMRIKKLLAKTERDQVIRRGEIEVSLPEQRVFVVAADNSKFDLHLTSLEFKLLVLLFKNEEHIFSRDQLLSKVWGENTFLTDRCIDTHVYSLRKKLGPRAFWIQSVYGQGYRLSLKEAGKRAEDKKAA